MTLNTMKTSVTYTEKFLKGNSLIELGYRDYIAARFLLNNQFVTQGLTLASTAIEKYWKSLIVFNLSEREKYNFHFDKPEKLKDLLFKHCPELEAQFDPIFLEVLEYAFKIRYYDQLKEPIFIGIYLNQFIGELDCTIDTLEKYLAQTQLGNEWITPYRRAIQTNEEHLYDNNFILSKQSKKAFMEKPDRGFSIHISAGSAIHTEQIVKGQSDIVNEYEGRISRFTEFKPGFYF